MQLWGDGPPPGTLTRGLREHQQRSMRSRAKYRGKRDEGDAPEAPAVRKAHQVQVRDLAAVAPIVAHSLLLNNI